MVKKTLGHGLTAVAGKVALKKISGILAGPIGWAITGVLVSINLAGPAYRVTVPACFVVAALRRKPKQINKAKTDNNKGGKGIFIFIFLVILVIFSPIIFFKREHQPQITTQATTKKAVSKNLKTLATKIKEWQQPLQLSFERIDRLEHGISGLNAFRIGFISPLSSD